MQSVNLPDLLGVRGASIRRERPLLFFTAIVIAEVVVFLLGFRMAHSSETGFSISLLQIGSPWEVVTSLAGAVVEVLVVVTAFRFIQRQALVVLATAVGYSLLITPVYIGLFQLRFGAAETPWMQMALPRFEIVLVYTLPFYVALALALARLRSLGVALLAGAAAGSILGDVGSGLFQAAMNRADAPLTLGFAAGRIPEGAVHAAVFAGLLLAGLRASRTLLEGPAQRLPPAFYAGQLAAYGGAGMALGIVVRTITDLTLLGLWTSPFPPEMEATRTGLLILIAANLLLALVAGIIFLVFLYRMWAAIQDGQVRTSPGRAVGLLFVPLFNFFWLFYVFAGFRREYNALLQRHALTLPPLRKGLSVAVPVLTLFGSLVSLAPFGFVLTVPVFGVVLLPVGRVCDAVNALPPSWPVAAS
ncbi:MAG: hypothetical protein HY651_13580 [Acidobacteria bacterium]|nr:hypothetical protein [Acidobacteriota bacterium]